MKRFFTLCSMLVACLFANQAAATILTSIKPIQLITLELTKDITKPEVLLGANTSPHDYALRPSDVKRLRQAELVIWYGHDLEPFLSKVLKDQKNVLTISQINGLSLREFSSEHHDSHDHHGHDHGTYDPHFWLGYKTTLQVAEAISAKLANIDAPNKDKYQQNLAAFKQGLTEQKNRIAQQLSSVEQVGYFVFHDAYAYFEQDFSLNHLGHFTVSPERKPGAKTLIKIRKTLAAAKAQCVFSEPQFTPAVVKSVIRGSKAKVGVLDPLGINIKAQSGGYFEFKQQLADSFSSCLD